jgi:hypothetical protein
MWTLNFNITLTLPPLSRISYTATPKTSQLLKDVFGLYYTRLNWGQLLIRVNFRIRFLCENLEALYSWNYPEVDSGTCSIGSSCRGIDARPFAAANNERKTVVRKVSIQVPL